MDMEKVAERSKLQFFPSHSLSLSLLPLLLRHVPLWKPISVDITNNFLLGNFKFFLRVLTRPIRSRPTRKKSAKRAKNKIAIEWFFVICCCARLGVFASIMWLWSDDATLPDLSMNLCFALPLLVGCFAFSLCLMRARRSALVEIFRCNQLELENYQKTGPFSTVCYLPQRLFVERERNGVAQRSMLGRSAPRWALISLFWWRVPRENIFIDEKKNCSRFRWRISVPSTISSKHLGPSNWRLQREIGFCWIWDFGSRTSVDCCDWHKKEKLTRTATIAALNRFELYKPTRMSGERTASQLKVSISTFREGSEDSQRQITETFLRFVSRSELTWICFRCCFSSILWILNEIKV